MEHEVGRILESKLIEMKAILKSISQTRKIINTLGAKKKGVYEQIDTYFNVHKGRLKLREVDGKPTAKLVYYEREDIPELKQSDVLILDTHDPRFLKKILQRALGVMVIVTKHREIYNYMGTQIHLDIVKDLGTFIEFERPITDHTLDRNILENLMLKLRIKQRDLITGSYSDLKLRKEKSD